MTAVKFPPCAGPRDLPEVRAWLNHMYRPESPLVRYVTDVKFIRETLGTAKLWWVTKETCDLLAASAPTIPDDVTFDWNDAPIPSGFAVFEQDLLGTDAEIANAAVRVSALMWGPVALPPLGAEWIGPNLYTDINEPGRVGLGIGMWTRASLDDGLDGDAMSRHANTLAALTEEMPNLSHGEPHTMHGHVFTYVGRTDWLNGRPINELTPGAPLHLGPDAAAQSMTEDRKLITALWAITRTPIVSLVREHVPRAAARRAARKGLDTDVRVLTLHGPRLDQHSEATGSTRNWKHQWVVSPHWRWQPYGPGRALRRLILIPAYRKGDRSKPLLGGERVWKVVPPVGVPVVQQ